MRIREAVAGTHRGQRAHQEDAVLKMPKLPLFAIADGMGGPGAGDHAASLAIGTVKGLADKLGAANARVAQDRSTEARLALGRYLDEVFNTASREVQREATRLGRPGMGSTLLVCTIVRNYAYIAHVGDSRAYLLRDGRAIQLTEDHTIAELHFRRGRLTREQYAASPDRRVLYQALGAGVEIDSDLAEVRLTGGDVLLLCSDGLPRALNDEVMAGCIEGNDLKGSLARLVETAVDAGAPDNLSCVLLAFEAEQGDEPIEALTDVMRDVFLFRDMSRPELLTVAPYLEELVVDTNATLVSESDAPTGFHLVVTGQLRVTRGKTHLADLKAGGHFGELSLTRANAPSGTTVRALVPSRVLVLSRDRFLELLRQKPELGARLSLALIDAVGERLREMNERLSAVERAARGELK